MMNVLFIARWYPNKYDSMFGLFIERHAVAVSRYCDVDLIYVHQDDKQGNKFNLENKVENNINVIRVYYKNSAALIPLFRKVINFYRYFRGNYIGYKFLIRQKKRPDIIHVNVLTRAAIMPYLLKKFCNIPYIVTEHWSRYLDIANTYKGFFRKLQTRVIVRNASAVTAVTGNLKEAMLKHGLANKNYHVIPNAADDAFFSYKHAGIKKDKIIITHISCFEDRSKNISGIIRVIDSLAKIRQDFECRMIGDGIDRQTLEKYSDELGLNNKFILYKGLLTGNELAEALSETDFLLIFSNYENMPVVINESFACGVPVIATNVGGISEYLKPDFGLLVESCNEDALLSAILKMMDTYQSYDKNKMKDYACKNFSYDAIGRQFKDLYNKCIIKNIEH